MPRIADRDLPALYRASDLASLNAQRDYLRLARLDLVLIVFGALLASLSVDDSSGRSALALVGAVSLGMSLLVTVLIRTLRREHVWYTGRAVAESVKTLAWRYMTKSEPYSGALTDEDADGKLATDLGDMLKQCQDIASELGGDLGWQPQITESMRVLRRGGTSDRCAAYVENRIDDQRRWYGSKAKSNQKSRDTWLYLMMMAQGLSVVFAIVIVRWPDTGLTLPGFFGALATSIWGWLQLKQHHELSQSYAVAAHELGLISERARHVDSDDDLSAFVADSENAISREHTLWLARRDHR